MTCSPVPIASYPGTGYVLPMTYETFHTLSVLILVAGIVLALILAALAFKGA